MEIALKEIKTDPVIQEEVSLKSPPKAKPKVYEVDKKEVSKNIQKFDRKVRVYTENPFSYAQASQKKTVILTPTASDMIADKMYNTVGKVLGIDTRHDWGRYYDKVYMITQWAKKNVGDDITKVVRYLTEKSRTIPSLGARRIDDLYIHASMKS